MARRKGPQVETDTVVVIGLGRFGAQVANSLVRLGHEVLAIDDDLRAVERWSQELTHVVQADATNQQTLRQLGVADFQRAVVAIGTAIEASVLTVLALSEIGLPQIWGRATSEQHAKILSAVGAHHVIFPEAAIAERIAHLMVSQILDFVEVGRDFAVATTPVPPPLHGRRLREISPRERYGVAVLAMKLPDGRVVPVDPETRIEEGCVLLVEGSISQVQGFATLD